MAGENRLLGGLRVIDLTNELGYLCGRILGDLGADVIKVEPPGGDPGRGIAPFYKDEPHPEHSLYWLAYNASKRGITLNIESPKGRELLEKLALRADFLLESFPPGYMRSIGLGYERLAEVNPRLIYVSISHFGQTGPYSTFKGCDIVDMAMGGILITIGDPDRPPVVMGIEQSYFQSGAQASTGAMMAHYYRKRSGVGQFVDVSVRDADLKMPYREVLQWKPLGVKVRRAGTKFDHGGRQSRQIWPCKDGYISWLPLGGTWGGREWQLLTEWMAAEGMAGPLSDIDWPNIDFPSVPQPVWDGWEEITCQFLVRHTMAEFEAFALQHGIRIIGVRNIPEVASFEQLAAREFWKDLAHPHLNATIRYPGYLFRSSETDIGIRSRAPMIGEHNEEVFGKELGLSADAVRELTSCGVV